MDVLVFYIDVGFVVEVLGHEYDTVEWSLFIDYSRASLRAVLLHNGNKLSSASVSSRSQHEGILRHDLKVYLACNFNLECNPIT